MLDALTPKMFLSASLRGAIGGALGAFVLLAILLHFEKFASWDIWGGWVVVAFLFFGLPYGAFIGLLVGTTIGLLNRQSGMNLGAVVRIVVGTAAASLFWSLIYWLKEPSAYLDTNSRLRYWLVVLMFATATGGIAGLAVGSQKARFDKDKKTQRPLEPDELDHPRAA